VHAQGCGGPQPAGRHTRHIHWSGMFIVMHMLLSMRGGVGVLNQLAVTLGIFIGQVCSLLCIVTKHAWGSSTSWPSHSAYSLVRYVHCYAYVAKHARGCGGSQPAGRHAWHIRWSGMFIVMHMLLSMRGGVGVLNQLAVTLGIFIGQVCSLLCICYKACTGV
jgi:hypothetical protein